MNKVSKKNKVLLVSGIYFPDIGGPATFIPKLARVLMRNDFAVSTISLTDCLNLERPWEEWDRIFIPRKLTLPLRFIVTTISIRVKAGRHSSIFSNGLYEEVAIASLLGSRPRVAKIVGDPIWERYRNKVDPLITLEEFNENTIKQFRYRIQRKLLVWSLNRFQTITTPSHQLAELVTKWGVKSQVEVIQNGIQITEIVQSQKEYDVVTISRLVSWKNVDMVIRICKELELKLGVIGSGPDEDKLRNLAGDSQVEFLGELSYEKVMTILSKSRIFALLSSYEGLSHSLLEAMNMEIPVIVSNAPGNTSVIRSGENGLVVSLDDDSTAAASFQRLIMDFKYAELLARNAKKDASTMYNQDVQLEHFVDLLKA